MDNTSQSNDQEPKHTQDANGVLLYRIYKTTVQRVALSIKSLNSHAVFLIILIPERQVIGWVGSACDSPDLDLARELGSTIMMKDFRIKEKQELPVIYENNEANKLLEIMLDLLWSSSTSYFSKLNAADRKHKLTNNSVSVGLIEKSAWGGDAGDYDFQETAFAHPDNAGTVPRVTFVPIEMETVAYVNIGDQWDIWIARGVPEEEERAILDFVEKSVIEQLSLSNAAFKKDVVSQYLKVVRQGEERTLFRRPLKIFTDFEPPGKTAPRPEPLPKQKKQHKKKTGDGNETGAKKTAFDVDKEREAERKRTGEPPPGGAQEAPNPNAVDFWAPLDSTGAGGDHGNPNDLLDLGDLARRVESVKNMNNNSSDDMKLTGTDVNVVTPGMVKVVEEYNMNPEQRRAVIDDAAVNPSSLIGYQVEIDEGICTGVFVVSKVKKTALLKKTLFYLVGLDNDEFWVRLKRGTGGKKPGQAFRPLRRVVEPQHINYDKQCGKSAAGASKPKKDKRGKENEDNNASNGDDNDEAVGAAGAGGAMTADDPVEIGAEDEQPLIKYDDDGETGDNADVRAPMQTA